MCVYIYMCIYIYIMYLCYIYLSIYLSIYMCIISISLYMQCRWYDCANPKTTALSYFKNIYFYSSKFSNRSVFFFIALQIVKWNYKMCNM